MSNFSLRAVIALLAAGVSGISLRAADVESVGELRALSAEEARSQLSVELEATLYYLDPTGFGFVEDQGHFVCVENLPAALPGSRLQISGRTNGGVVSNMLHATKCVVTGTDTMKDAIDLSGQAVSLLEHDCKLVRISGVVQFVRHGAETTTLGVETASQMLHVVQATRLSYEESLKLVGATVDVNGNVAVDTDAVADEGINIFCSPDWLELVKPPVTVREPTPVKTLDAIWSDSRATNFRLSGQVIYVAPYHDFCVEHNEHIAWIKNRHHMRANTGEYVEVYGDCDITKEHSELRARMVTTFGSSQLPAANAVSAIDIATGSNSMRRVKLIGTVVEFSYGDDEGRLIINSDGHRISCRISDDFGRFSSLDLGSADVLAVTGLSTLSDAGDADFGLYVAGASDVVVQSRKTHGDRQPLLLVGAGLLLVSLVWGRSLLKKLRRGRSDLSRLAAEMKMSIDAIDDAILIVDCHGKVLHSSRRVHDFFGITLKSEDTADPLLDLLGSDLGAGDILRKWYDLSHEDDRVIRRMPVSLSAPFPEALEVTSTPITDESNAVIGRVWVFRDVSTREQLQEQLIHSQKQEAIGRLAGGFAHDFNNLLIGIGGSLDLATMDRTRTIDECMEPLTIALEASQRASSMVRQLLGFSRKTSLNIEPNDVNDVVRRAHALLAPTIRGSLDFTMDLAGDLPAVSVDATQLEQVVLNVCLNAVDAIEGSGKISVRTLLVVSNQHKAEPDVCIAISDDGIGMSTETVARIFEPYFSTKVGSGVGLGLAMSEGIVHQHKGRIEVDSKPGWGTEFRIILPAGSAKADRSSLPTQTPSNHRLTGQRILIVDDEEIVRTTVSQLLEVRGGQPETVSGGIDALDFLEGNSDSVDVVLLDWTMPVMSGRETLIQIRQKFPSLPVIVMSGFTFDCDEWDSGDDLRPDATLQKPFQIDQLCQLVDTVGSGSDGLPKKTSFE